MVKTALRGPDRLQRRATPPWPRRPSRALWHHLDEPSEQPDRTRAATPAASTSSTRPGYCATRSASWSPARLAGLFDDHTNIDVDWSAPIQSLSLSRLNPLGDEAIGIALVCLNSWGRGMREIAAPGDLRVVVRDEVWKVMRLGVEAVESPRRGPAPLPRRRRTRRRHPVG